MIITGFYHTNKNYSKECINLTRFILPILTIHVSGDGMNYLMQNQDLLGYLIASENINLVVDSDILLEHEPELKDIILEVFRKVFR